MRGETLSRRVQFHLPSKTRISEGEKKTFNTVAARVRKLLNELFFIATLTFLVNSQDLLRTTT